MVDVSKAGRKKKNRICILDWDSTPRAWFGGRMKLAAEEDLTEERHLVIKDPFIST